MGCVFTLVEKEQFYAMSVGVKAACNTSGCHSLQTYYKVILLIIHVFLEQLYKCDGETVNCFPERFFFSASYCVEIILSLTTQGVPDTTTFTEGDGCVCLCVCLCLGKCLLTCRNMLLRLMCIDPPVTSQYSLFVCLFVSGYIYYCYFISFRVKQGNMLLPGPAVQTTLHVMSVNTHSTENWSM